MLADAREDVQNGLQEPVVRVDQKLESSFFVVRVVVLDFLLPGIGPDYVFEYLRQLDVQSRTQVLHKELQSSQSGYFELDVFIEVSEKEPAQVRLQLKQCLVDVDVDVNEVHRLSVPQV